MKRIFELLEIVIRPQTADAPALDVRFLDSSGRPFAEPGEGRRPTLTWPREIPIEGDPADVTEIVTAYADWLVTSNVPKLFLKAEPGGSGLIWLPEGAFAMAFAQNASAEERALLAAVQRPISVNCITVPVGRPLWKDVPSWFLIAEDDRMIVPDTQHYMAERMKAKIKTHAVDHTPSVTAPAVVVDIIRDAVSSATGN